MSQLGPIACLGAAVAKKKAKAQASAKRDKKGKFAPGGAGAGGDGSARPVSDRDSAARPDSAAGADARATKAKKAAAKSRPAAKKKATAARAGNKGAPAKKATSKKKAAKKKAPTRKRTEAQKAARRVDKDSRLADQSIAQLTARANAGDAAARAELEKRRAAVEAAAGGKKQDTTKAPGGDSSGLDGNECTFQFFADSLGIGSVRTIQRLANDGAVVRAGDKAGRLLFGESMVALCKFLLQGGPPHKRATEDARRRKLENDAIIQEMKIAEKAGDLVDRVEHERFCAELLSTARRGYENMKAAAESASSVDDGKRKAARSFSEALTALDDVLVAASGEPDDDDGFGDSGD